MGCSESKKESKKYTNFEYGRYSNLLTTDRIFKGSFGSISTTDPDLSQEYQPITVLGDGDTSETWLMCEEATDRLVAVKAIKRPIPEPLVEMLKREIEIQAKIGEGHLNIVNLYEVLLTKRHLLLVQEYAQGGSLTDYISDRYETIETSSYGRGLCLSEDEALFFFRQYISAVEFCHKNQVMHRDLKLDNTLLDGSDPPLIKICDFGFSKTLESEGETSTRTIIGTPVYMSPEILACELTNKRSYDGMLADIWSSGVMLFVMLMGDFPFDNLKNPDPNSCAAYKEMLWQQTTNKWSDCVGTPNIKHLIQLLTPTCKDLLDRILTADVEERLSIEELKRHTWFTRKLPAHLDCVLNHLKRSQAQLNQIFSAQDSDKRTEGINYIVYEAARKPSSSAYKSNYTGIKATLEKNEKNSSTLLSTGKIKKLYLKTGIDTFTTERTYSDYKKEKGLSI